MGGPLQTIDVPVELLLKASEVTAALVRYEVVVQRLGGNCVTLGLTMVVGGFVTPGSDAIPELYGTKTTLTGHGEHLVECF